jgi:hypothetical protein
MPRSESRPVRCIAHTAPRIYSQRMKLAQLPRTGGIRNVRLNGSCTRDFHAPVHLRHRSPRRPPPRSSLPSGTWRERRRSRGGSTRQDVSDTWRHANDQPNVAATQPEAAFLREPEMFLSNVREAFPPVTLLRRPNQLTTFQPDSDSRILCLPLTVVIFRAVGCLQAWGFLSYWSDCFPTYVRILVLPSPWLCAFSHYLPGEPSSF